MHTAANEELSIPQSIVSGRTAQWRMATGVLQGAVLYFLYWSFKNTGWPITNMYLFAPLGMIFLFVPALLVSGLGHLENRRIAIWMVTVIAVCAALTIHDLWRSGLVQHGWGFFGAIPKGSYMPSGWLLSFLPVGLYIAHALVLAGAADNRHIARYPSYFEISWKLIIQIAFSLLFVGVLWLILWLGATLFMLVKLDFLRELLQRLWFCIIVTTFAFATALHVTDVRPGIVRGIRSLLLVLMSWLLPVTTLIVGGFLISLPFVGLEPLWATRHATSVLLGATAVLVLLINATFQSGELGKQVARVLRIVARVACVLLLPMVLIAIYSLTLRIQQYGWTNDRIIAAASLLVAVCYAVGYMWAAFERGAWLARIAPTNVVTAFLILAILIALFTPIADPARLSVASQMARLESGKVSATEFDYAYLKFDGTRYGTEALQTLKARTTGADAATIRTLADTALNRKNKWDRNEGNPIANADSRVSNITVWPNTTSLPDGFLQQDWNKDVSAPECLRYQNRHCNAYLNDLNGDSRIDILLKDDNRYSPIAVFTTNKTTGQWELSATIRGAKCKEMIETLKAGSYELAVPEFKDLQIGGRRLHVEPKNTDNGKCAEDEHR
jgi:hypothetical protein